MKAQMFNKSWWVNETNPEKLKDIYQVRLLESGFTILKFTEHYFKPYGYTCLCLLSESHLAIHTFPEEDKSYIELSSCVEEYFNSFLQKEELMS